MTAHEIWLAGGNVLVVCRNRHTLTDAFDNWAVGAGLVLRIGVSSLTSPADGTAYFVTSEARPEQLHGLTIDACKGIDRLPDHAREIVEAAMSKSAFRPTASPRLHLNRWQHVHVLSSQCPDDAEDNSHALQAIAQQAAAFSQAIATSEKLVELAAKAGAEQAKKPARPPRPRPTLKDAIQGSSAPPHQVTP